MDIISVIVILITVCVIAIKQYGIPMNVKNSITDASTHYWVADEFYNYSMLLIEDNSDVLGFFDERAFMPGSYINTGILFKIFSLIIRSLDSKYKHALYFILVLNVYNLGSIETIYSYMYLTLLYMCPIFLVTRTVKIVKLEN